MTRELNILVKIYLRVISLLTRKISFFKKYELLQFCIAMFSFFMKHLDEKEFAVSFKSLEKLPTY